MKQALLKLFASTPALQGRPLDFLDDLAEDVQAVIIRALGLVIPGASDAAAALANDVEDVWVSQFGISLSNLFTFSPHGDQLTPSRRKQVVQAMIQTMLLEQEQQRAAMTQPTDDTLVPATIH